MEEAKTMKTPMSSSIKLDKDEKGKFINSTMYKGMIGSLLYLTASRPDIMYSVCLCARFQSCPKESHLSSVKRILKYLKGTMDIGLWYPKGDNFELIGFSNADFTGCKVERKNTSDTCHFLGHSLVSWHSKKQNLVALSMAEAEYIAVETSLGKILDRLQALEWILGRAEVRASDLGARAFVSGQFLLNLLFGRMGWLPIVTIFELIFLTLVHAFYSRVTYGLGGPITSTVKGIEIKLSSENIYRIFDIPSVGIWVYESKVWPTVLGFEPREAIQRVFKDVRVDLSRETDFKALTVYDNYDEQSLGQMKFEKAPDGS
ncbi:Retrovirus-related Pol polyprotein from transposon RE1 [Vitis vinifera]|uniref:Retrovirus-related Pol polyprotein from transposon RE1 n=1 Tax=Vitis vinifera TaxID=29760 RepID=A0A438H6R2_VITVI|nr:Retrovirus-related Pol polyprotein from transposon RE1 [Vitis vinifera]